MVEDYCSGYNCEVCGNLSIYYHGNGIYKCHDCNAIYTRYKNKDFNHFLSNPHKGFMALHHGAFIIAEEEFNLVIKKFPMYSLGYWGRFLARHGIKYLCGEPWCDRTTYDDIREDDDYKMVMEYADDQLKSKYMAEILKIEEAINKRCEEASMKKYDIFYSVYSSDIEKPNEIYKYLRSVNYEIIENFQLVNGGYEDGSMNGSWFYDCISRSKILIVYLSKSPKLIAARNHIWRQYCAEINSGKRKNTSLIVIYDGIDARSITEELKNGIILKADSKNFYPDLLALIRENIIESVNEMKKRKLNDYKEMLANIEINDSLENLIGQLKEIRTELWDFKKTVEY